jgi:hypothetical protein
LSLSTIRTYVDQGKASRENGTNPESPEHFGEDDDDNDDGLLRFYRFVRTEIVL